MSTSPFFYFYTYSRAIPLLHWLSDIKPKEVSKAFYGYWLRYQHNDMSSYNISLALKSCNQQKDRENKQHLNISRSTINQMWIIHRKNSTNSLNQSWINSIILKILIHKTNLFSLYHMTIFLLNLQIIFVVRPLANWTQNKTITLNG